MPSAGSPSGLTSMRSIWATGNLKISESQGTRNKSTSTPGVMILSIFVSKFMWPRPGLGQPLPLLSGRRCRSYARGTSEQDGRACLLTDHVWWSVHRAQVHAREVLADDPQGEELDTREDRDDGRQEREAGDAVTPDEIANEHISEHGESE